MIAQVNDSPLVKQETKDTETAVQDLDQYAIVELSLDTYNPLKDFYAKQY